MTHDSKDNDMTRHLCISDLCNSFGRHLEPDAPERAEVPRIQAAPITDRLDEIRAAAHDTLNNPDDTRSVLWWGLARWHADANRNLADALEAIQARRDELITELETAENAAGRWARIIEDVRAYADERAAYGRRGRTVHSARIATDLHAILDTAKAQEADR